MSETAPKVSMLSSEQLLGADDLPEEVVDVPEWGGQVKVRALGWSQVADARQRAKVGGVIDDDRFSFALLQQGLVQPSIREDQVEFLRGKNKLAIERVLRVIERLSGLTEEVAAESEADFPQ